MKWYIVGGAVRDMLLGLDPKDADLAFSGNADELTAQFPEAFVVGQTVSVYLLQGHECMPLRGGTILTDLMARDLTINALALDEDGILYAHPLALYDLAKGILRPASEHAFFDDPTRIYRLARFGAKFPHFSLHEEGKQQVRSVIKEGLHKALPAERVGNELLKALQYGQASRFFYILHENGALDFWFQELENAAQIPAGPARWHSESLLEHLCAVMDKMSSPVERWMALCHDIGKLTTDQKILPHHYGHEQRGDALVLNLGKRLCMPNRFIKAGRLIASEHMKARQFHHLKTRTKRDLLYKVHTAHVFDEFWAVAEADCGVPLLEEAQQNLGAMLSVSLPEKWKNRGAQSGEHLRFLQCEAIRKLS